MTMVNKNNNKEKKKTKLQTIFVNHLTELHKIIVETNYVIKLQLFLFCFKLTTIVYSAD